MQANALLRGGVAALPARRACHCCHRGAPSATKVAALRRPRVSHVARAEGEDVSALGAACSIDDMSSCSLAELEMMYIDSLWGFYQSGNKVTLSDDQYDRLKEELNWQGSGIPTLRRDEIRFVESSIEYYRGNEILDDKEYDKLKEKIQAQWINAGGKRTDVMALLLYAKGQQLLDPEKYEDMKEDMIKLGIDVGMKGASCTLSQTSDKLSLDVETLLLMYGALAALPFGAGAFIWKFADILLPGDFSLLSFVVFVGAFTTALVIGITNVAEINSPEILKGQCPCCETKITVFFGPNNPNPAQRKCTVCGTAMSLDKTSQKLSLVDGPKFT